MKFFSLYVALPALLYTGCGRSEAERTREAVLRVLQAERAAHKEHLGPPPADADLAYVLRTMDAYCRKMDKLAVDDCPADFRLAFRNCVNAWKTYGDEVRKIQARNDDLLTDVLKSLSMWLPGHSEPPAPNPLDVAGKQTRETYTELEKIGAKYGAAL